MTEMVKQSKRPGFLMTAAAFVLVVAGMRAAEALLVPFLLSVFFAIICTPPLSWLQRRGLPAWLSMLIVLAVIVGMGMAAGGLVGTSLNDFSKNLPVYQERLQKETTELLTWLGNKGVKIPDQKLMELIDPGAAMNFAASVLNGLRGALTNAFLILLTVVFILFEVSGFPNKLRAAISDPDASFSYLNRFTTNVNRYVVIKTLTSLGTAIAITTWLFVLGVDYPLLWGLLAFLLNYVPNIGSIIAAVPPVLLALIQLGGGSAGWVAVGYLVVNIVVGSIIEPRLMGRGLGLSTLVVFVSLVFWGWVLGPVGMFLSVPLTMTIKIALDSNEGTRWMAVMLGSEASAKAVLAGLQEKSSSEPSETEPQQTATDNDL